MKHPSRTFFLLSAMMAIVLAGCEQPTTRRTQNQTTGSPKVIPVKTVAAVQEEIVKSTQQPATIYAHFETEIRPRVAGYVSDLHADIGDVVKQGDVLAKLDVPELQKQRETQIAQIELLVAEERRAEAGVALADASVQSAMAQLSQAKSELEGVEASLAAAISEFDRTSDLVNRGSLQNRLLDEARKKRDSERAAKNAVIAAVTAAEAGVGVAEAERAAAQAQLEMAQAKTTVVRRQLDELQVSLDFAHVTAPFDGIITQRHVDLGDLIESRTNENTSPLFVLSQVDKVRVHIPVPEVDATFVQPGDTVQLTFPSFASQPPLEAIVTRRSGSLDPNTRTMTVEAEMDNADGKLLPGMFGQARILRSTKASVTMLPSRAVRFDESGRAYVYLLNEDDKVTIANVTTGIDTGTKIEILAGVQPGSLVIGPHLRRFSEGQQVRPLSP